MIPSQMLKGILEGCVLKVICDSETYGYEISQKLREHGFEEISEGTIYPLLLRMEKNGLIEATYKASALGPKRKYFHITGEGKKELTDFLTAYREMEQAVRHLFAEGRQEAAEGKPEAAGKGSDVPK